MFPTPPLSHAFSQQASSQPAAQEKLVAIAAALRQQSPEGVYLSGLALLYSNNIAGAKLCFKLAAEKEHPLAYIQLHRLSVLGIVEPLNVAHAQYWKQKIIAQTSWLQAQAHNSSISLDAQCNLAWCYMCGIGVEKNQNEAMRRFQLVVDSSCPNTPAIAQLGLGYCLANDEKQDKLVIKLKVYDLYKAASDQGDALAPLYLAEYCLKTASDTPDNLKEAARWYFIAAERGNIEAQCLLGEICMSGDKGIEKNEDIAVYWYQKAAIGGHSTAQYKLGLYYVRLSDYDESIKKIMGGGLRNIDKAIKWLECAVAQKEWSAYLLLTQCYEKIGNKAQAQATHCRYADDIILTRPNNNPDIDFAIAQIYRRGGNLKKALQFYRVSATKGYIKALLELTKLYLEKNDPQEAVIWAQKAAEQNNSDPVINAEANYWLGRCYTVLEKPHDALPRYLTAANANQGNAMLALARFYTDRYDFPSAFEWCSKAKAQNHPDANTMMNHLMFMENMYKLKA